MGLLTDPPDETGEPFTEAVTPAAVHVGVTVALVVPRGTVAVYAFVSAANAGLSVTGFPPADSDRPVSWGVCAATGGGASRNSAPSNSARGKQGIGGDFTGTPPGGGRADAPENGLLRFRPGASGRAAFVP